MKSAFKNDLRIEFLFWRENEYHRLCRVEALIYINNLLIAKCSICRKLMKSIHVNIHQWLSQLHFPFSDFPINSLFFFCPGVIEILTFAFRNE